MLTQQFGDLQIKKHFQQAQTRASAQDAVVVAVHGAKRASGGEEFGVFHLGALFSLKEAHL
jgi:hypothetical protein